MIGTGEAVFAATWVAAGLPMAIISARATVRQGRENDDPQMGVVWALAVLFFVIGIVLTWVGLLFMLGLGAQNLRPSVRDRRRAGRAAALRYRNVQLARAIDRDRQALGLPALRWEEYLDA